MENEYYGKKAPTINVAGESRTGEEEVRSAENFLEMNSRKQLIVLPNKFTYHVEDQFPLRTVAFTI